MATARPGKLPQAASARGASGRPKINARRSISRVLSRPRGSMDGHSSWPIVADRLQQPTRTSGAVTPAGEPARHPYSVLLQAGFTVPSPLPSTRWALTPPFHPYRPRKAGGLLSVALSLGSPRAGVTRRLFTMEPGLSSTHRSMPRPSDRLAAAQMRASGAPVNLAATWGRLPNSHKSRIRDDPRGTAGSSRSVLSAGPQSYPRPVSSAPARPLPATDAAGCGSIL